MTNEQATTILKRLRHWRALDNKHDEALIAYCKVIAPDSYAPITGESFTSTFIDGITCIMPEIGDDLSYIAWEASGMEGKATVTTEDGKSYDFKKDEEIIEYLIANH